MARHDMAAKEGLSAVTSANATPATGAPAAGAVAGGNGGNGGDRTTSDERTVPLLQRSFYGDEEDGGRSQRQSTESTDRRFGKAASPTAVSRARRTRP